ncbi:phosphopentomutase [Eubacteriales bacterium OttesenSCG-928-N13]|nr:phosphopentomutase [Eubacteriales bacterium OttesenSCG-928-N13]
MKRVCLIVLDSLGIGNAPDAKAYGDEGANTLKSIMGAHPDLPNLTDLGLYNAARLPEAIEDPLGCYGRMTEASAGKDTTTGHWEMAGLPVPTAFPVFPDGFPQELIDRFEEEVGLGVIGNVAASGTEIIERLGDEHIRTGKLIVYTSADSVFQIAAHEAIVPPAELWHICRMARRMLVGEYGVGRVIARPFIGNPGSFERTGNRRDFSLDPTGKTMLDLIKDAGKDVIGVGKIEDIFNHRGLTQSNHASGNEACIDAMVDYLKQDRWRGLVFANLVDGDMMYGHRRDADGYARMLEAFDRRLPEIMRLLGEDAMLIITADHGCDPGYRGTDHTREQVPVLAYSLGALEGVDLGERKSFADVSATILEALGIKEKLTGTSFFSQIID